MIVVVKGAFASLAQNETSLLVAAGQPAFAAGTLLKRNADEEWEVAGASDAGDATHPGAALYMALLGSDNLTARYAGNQSGNTGADAEQAKIPAVALAETRRVITNMVDDVEDYAVGDLLTVGADGKLVDHANGKTVYAQVTKAAFDHFDAHHVAVAGFRTGGNVRALEIETRFQQQVATA